MRRKKKGYGRARFLVQLRRGGGGGGFLFNREGKKWAQQTSFVVQSEDGKKKIRL